METTQFHLHVGFLRENPEPKEIIAYDREFDRLLKDFVQKKIVPKYQNDLLLKKLLTKVHDYKFWKFEEEVSFPDFLQQTDSIVDEFKSYLPKQIPEELNWNSYTERVVRVYLDIYHNKMHTSMTLMDILKGKDAFIQSPECVISDEEKSFCLYVAVLLSIRKLNQKKKKGQSILKKEKIYA